MPARNANYRTMNKEARRRTRDHHHPTKQLNRIFARDKGICQICFEPCLRREASRDHIKEFFLCTVEEARSDDNMRLAHILCNLIRAGATPKSGKLPIPAIEPLTYKIAIAFPDFSS